MAGLTFGWFFCTLPAVDKHPWIFLIRYWFSRAIKCLGEVSTSSFGMTVIPCKVVLIRQILCCTLWPLEDILLSSNGPRPKAGTGSSLLCLDLLFFLIFVEVVEKCTIDTSQVIPCPDRGPNPGLHCFSQDPALGGIALLCAEPYMHWLVICVIPCLDCRLLAIVRAICCHSLRMN